nr:hypothetical protein [uncultured Clostridium sp.]
MSSDKEECSNTIYNCLYAIVNIANLLNLFLPQSSYKIKEWLVVGFNNWSNIKINQGNKTDDFEILFVRLDKKLIHTEMNSFKLFIIK